MTRSDQDAPARDMRARFRGCLLGGAVGDALGAPVEFRALHEIIARYGPAGVTDMVEGAFGRWAITDDTQMTFFTIEGLLRAYVRGSDRGICAVEAVVDDAYLRWLATQDERPTSALQGPYSYLLSIPALHKRRAPGNTCLSALQTRKDRGAPARNDSKGCGGIMRVAPVGLCYAKERGAPDVRRSFEMRGRRPSHPCEAPQLARRFGYRDGDRLTCSPPQVVPLERPSPSAHRQRPRQRKPK